MALYNQQRDWKSRKSSKKRSQAILSDYDKTLFQLLDISKELSMEVKRLRVLVTEILKTLNDSNPVFMKDIFSYCQNKNHEKHYLYVHSRKDMETDMETTALVS